MTQEGPLLSEIATFAYGFKTGDDERFLSATRETTDHQPFIASADIRRYGHAAPTAFVWYRPDLMKAHRKTARPGEAARFEAEKILIGRMGKRLFAAYDEGGLYVKDAMLLLTNEQSEVPVKALLAVLNSRFLGFIYREFFVTVDVLKNALLGLPLPVAFRDSPRSAEVMRLERLASRLMATLQSVEESVTERDQDFYRGRAAQIDAQIDSLVNELYGLSDADVDAMEKKDDQAADAS